MNPKYDHAAADRALIDARAALARGDHGACLAALERAHDAGHDHARIHFGVHTTWMRLAVRTGNLRMALGQVAPILFAVPVSVFHSVSGT